MQETHRYSIFFHKRCFGCAGFDIVFRCHLIPWLPDEHQDALRCCGELTMVLQDTLNCKREIQLPNTTQTTNFFCCLVAQPCLTLVTPWTVAHQAPLSLGFSRHEYWSRLPFPTPGDLPDQGLNPCFLYVHLLHWQVDSLPLCHLRSYILKE